MRWILAISLSSLIAGCASLPDNVERPVSAAFNAPEQTLLGQLVQQRKARMGRNPATGEPIKIPAKTVVKARIVKQLKDAVLPRK